VRINLPLDFYTIVGITAKERRNNNFPIWAAAFFIVLRCFVGRVAKAMLPSRASSDEKILTPKT
jgi:hypothetical protein